MLDPYDNFDRVFPVTTSVFGENGRLTIIGTISTLREPTTLVLHVDDPAGDKLYFHPGLFEPRDQHKTARLRLDGGKVILEFMDSEHRFTTEGSRRAAPLVIQRVSVIPYLKLAGEVWHHRVCMHPDCPKGQGNIVHFENAAIFYRQTQESMLLCASCADNFIAEDPSLRPEIFFGRDLPPNAIVEIIERQ